MPSKAVNLAGLFVFFFAFSCHLSATTLVPISVGDITILIPINDPPLAADDSGLTVNEDATATFDILLNDSDENLSALQEKCAVEPFHSCVELIDTFPHAVSFTGGLLHFTGSQHFNGPVTLGYRLFDEDGQGSDLAQVSISVTPVGDIPEPRRDGYEDKPGEDRIISIEARKWEEVDFLWNDVDPDGGELFLFAVKEAVEYPEMSIEISPDRKKLRVYSESFRGLPYSIDYVVENDQGRRSAGWTYSRIYVVESSIPNELPTAANFYASIQEDTPPGSCNLDNLSQYDCVVELDILSLVDDPDGLNSGLEIVELDDSWNGVRNQSGSINGVIYHGYTYQGIVTRTNNKLYYRPKAAFYDDAFGGEDRFAVKVSDERGGIVTQVVTVRRVSDAGIPPQVSITAPASGEAFYHGSDILVTADVTDDSAVTQVVFSLDNGYTHTLTTSPYQTVIAGLAVNASYTLTVTATDDGNNTSSSSTHFAVIPRPAVSWSKQQGSVNEELTITGVAPEAVSCVSLEYPDISFNLAPAIVFYRVFPESISAWQCVDAQNNVVQTLNAPLHIQKLAAPTNLRGH